MARGNWRKLKAGWVVQTRVIHALMLRELTTRFGRENIGFLWIMGEPLLFAVLVGLVWRLTRGAEEHGMSIIAFVVTGYLPITMFRHGISKSVAVFTANSGLLYHRQIKVLDFILVRFIIELLGSMMAYLFIAVVLMIFKQFPVPADIGLFLGGWFLYALVCFSLCLVIAPLSEVSEIMEKFIPVTTYVMIPFSGLFYMVSWAAPAVRPYMLWSPFINGMEMMRGGIWGNDVTVYYNIWNPIGFSIVAATFGLGLCRYVRRELAVE